VEEVETVLTRYILVYGHANLPVIDLTLARGLNYYTGVIIEVKSLDVAMGSIGGGGRYDDLTGIFGFPDMSGVGISFGLDRIFEVIEELNLFPKKLMGTTKALFINFGAEAELIAMQLMHGLRKNEIAVEMYPSAEKIKKQMEYANKKEIPLVILIGENEMLNKVAIVKNMINGEQETVPFNELEKKLTD
jgi:histidyl-tRNA synthetase